MKARRKAARPAPDDEELESSLGRKYRVLSKKYASLVARLGDNQHERMMVFRLGWFALKAHPSAMALVSEKGIIAVNATWHTFFNESSPSSWRLVSSDEPVNVNLRLLIREEAENFRASGEQRMQKRFERLAANGETLQLIELQLERGVIGFDDVVAIIAQDASARYFAERELQRARNAMLERQRVTALGELASSVAHELGTTVRALAMRLEVLAADAASMRAQGENIEQMKRAVEVASTAMQRLRDFGQRGPSATEPVDLAAVVGEAATLAAFEHETFSTPANQPPPFRVAVSLPKLPLVRGVATEIGTVFLNLFRNAREAMTRGGKVSVTGAYDGVAVTIEVTDDGPGIVPENQERIFEPFFSTKGGGATGLGLPLARNILESMGAAIAAGNAPGGGARFAVTFQPAAAESASVNGQTKPPPAAADAPALPSPKARRGRAAPGARR